MIDLVELRARIAEKSNKGIHAAPVLFDIIEELEHARGERPAVVAWLRDQSERLMSDEAPVSAYIIRSMAHDIERGEHRREGER